MKATVLGRRVERRYCETTCCDYPVFAVSVWRWKRGRAPWIRFELCERCTLAEIVRRADGNWAGRILRLQEVPRQSAGVRRLAQ